MNKRLCLHSFNEQNRELNLGTDHHKSYGGGGGGGLGIFEQQEFFFVIKFLV